LTRILTRRAGASDCYGALTASLPAKSMNSQNQVDRRIAVVQWSEYDGLAEIIRHELLQLGYHPEQFHCYERIPKGLDVIFSFGPYGKLMPLVRQLESLPVAERPLLAHWNTEGLPDLRIPWFVMKPIGAGRSWVGRFSDNLNGQLPPGSMRRRLVSLADSRMHRFRWLGDYFYAHGQGVIGVLVDTSAIYSQMRSQHGLPTLFAPWGSSPLWYDDLQLERDIDVLWMGNRREKRRRALIDRVRRELQRHGVEVYMADDEENPFIFGEERTRFLNRAKITLNMTRTWHDDNFTRFSMAAPNRSLVVSEPLLSHCPAYRSGVHYVSAAHDELASAIVYYLEHSEERLHIAENAFHLATTQLTLFNSVQTIMLEVEGMLQRRGGASGRQVPALRDERAG
jgi:hypothetical protein